MTVLLQRFVHGASIAAKKVSSPHRIPVRFRIV
jgi:hypothetical protein